MPWCRHCVPPKSRRRSAWRCVGRGTLSELFAVSHFGSHPALLPPRSHARPAPCSRATAVRNRLLVLPICVEGHDRGSSMPPKGSSEGRAPSKYGGFNFSALAVKVSFTSRSKGTTTGKSICTHGSRKEDPTKRDLWVEVVTLWINKLKVHQAWKKVETQDPPPLTHLHLSLHRTLPRSRNGSDSSKRS